MLWILRTGAPWRDVPARYPPYQTYHRRFQQWVRAGVFDAILYAFASDLAERGDLDFSECFLDGTFDLAGAPAKKEAPVLARRNAATAPTSWQGPMPMVVQSPSTLQALRRMRSPWVSRHWRQALPSIDPNGASAIQPATAIRIMWPWPRRVVR